MEIDPDFMYDNDSGDYQDIDDEPQVEEFDEYGNPIYMAMAAGFGYHMAQDELEERQIAEDILKRQEEKLEAPVKIPLASRHVQNKGKMTPFGRWATKVNHDLSKLDTEIEYTVEERLAILEIEGGENDWDG